MSKPSNKSPYSNNGLTWVIAGIGTAIFVVLVCILFELRAGNGNASKSDVSPDNASDNSVTMESWDTDIKEFSIQTDSGEKFQFNTPEGFYSLSDQYLNNLKDYYSVSSVKSDTMVVVGDSESPYSAKTLINANKLSDVSNMFNQLGYETTEADMLQSEAYVYMTTGELPEELPLNYKIDEVDKWKVNGVEFVAYEVSYDTEYEKEAEETESDEKKESGEDEGESSDKKEVETVHTEEICCYSNTEDPIEIVIYQSEFDKDSAVKYLKEFLGVKTDSK